MIYNTFLIIYYCFNLRVSENAVLSQNILLFSSGFEEDYLNDCCFLSLENEQAKLTWAVHFWQNENSGVSSFASISEVLSKIFFIFFGRSKSKWKIYYPGKKICKLDRNVSNTHRNHLHMSSIVGKFPLMVKMRKESVARQSTETNSWSDICILCVNYRKFS